MTNLQQVSEKTNPGFSVPDYGNDGLNLWELPDTILPADKRIFYPDWNNRPPRVDPMILLDGKRILSRGNYSSITSLPGVGKSGVCEAIAAAALNQDCDSLGFLVNLSNDRSKVVYIDTERSLDDSWDSMERTFRRAGICSPSIDKRFIPVSFRRLSIEERRKFTIDLLTTNQDIGLIIIDGIGDYVKDVNNADETDHIGGWIKSFNPNIGVILTIHTNPGEGIKARGHLGSEILRQSEAVLLLDKIDPPYNRITTDFKYGKVRNDSHASVYFEYSLDKAMFVTSDYIPPSPNRQQKFEKNKELVAKIFEGKDRSSYGDMLKVVMSERKVLEKTAEGIVNGLKNSKLIVKLSVNVWTKNNEY